MNQTDKLDLQTPNFVNENVAKIAKLFPNCVTESANGKAVDLQIPISLSAYY